MKPAYKLPIENEFFSIFVSLTDDGRVHPAFVQIVYNNVTDKEIIYPTIEYHETRKDLILRPSNIRITEDNYHAYQWGLEEAYKFIREGNKLLKEMNGVSPDVSL